VAASAVSRSDASSGSFASADADDSKAAKGLGLGAGKRLQVDWTTIIGEHIRDIWVGRISKGLAPSQVDIVLIGEHSTFILKENGTLRTQKRNDFSAMSSCLFSSGTDGTQSLVVFHGFA
jgi:hypothetical protein